MSNYEFDAITDLILPVGYLLFAIPYSWACFFWRPKTSEEIEAKLVISVAGAPLFCASTLLGLKYIPEVIHNLRVLFDVLTR